MGPPERGRREASTDMVEYVVNGFLASEKHYIDNAEAIISITPYTSVTLSEDRRGE